MTTAQLKELLLRANRHKTAASMVVEPQDVREICECILEAKEIAELARKRGSVMAGQWVEKYFIEDELNYNIAKRK